MSNETSDSKRGGAGALGVAAVVALGIGVARFGRVAGKADDIARVASRSDDFARVGSSLDDVARAARSARHLDDAARVASVSRLRQKTMTASELEELAGAERRLADSGWTDAYDVADTTLNLLQVLADIRVREREGLPGMSEDAFLHPLLHAESPTIRLAVLHTLREGAADDADVRAAMNALQRDGDPRVRCAAAEVLGAHAWWDDIAELSLRTQQFVDDDAAVKSACKAALVQIDARQSD